MPQPRDVKETQDGVHWLALTMPDAGSDQDGEPRRRRRVWDDDDAAQAPAPGRAVSATEALDRIEIAPEVREKIAEMLWAGSSLVISDKPMSGETGPYTDFVILTR
jgi:hypothetical protein